MPADVAGRPVAEVRVQEALVTAWRETGHTDDDLGFRAPQLSSCAAAINRVHRQV